MGPERPAWRPFAARYLNRQRQCLEQRFASFGSVRTVFERDAAVEPELLTKMPWSEKDATGVDDIPGIDFPDSFDPRADTASVMIGAVKLSPARFLRNRLTRRESCRKLGGDVLLDYATP